MNWKKAGIGCGIGCGLLAILLVCGGVGAKLWWAHSGRGFMEGLNAASHEGEEYAATHDAPACVAEAAQRTDECAGIASTCQISASTFLYNCLSKAKTKAFCKDVPPTASTTKDIDKEDAWRRETCEGLGHPGEKCEQLLMQEQLACEQS